MCGMWCKCVVQVWLTIPVCHVCPEMLNYLGGACACRLWRALVVFRSGSSWPGRRPRANSERNTSSPGPHAHADGRSHAPVQPPDGPSLSTGGGKGRLRLGPLTSYPARPDRSLPDRWLLQAGHRPPFHLVGGALRDRHAAAPFPGGGENGRRGERPLSLKTGRLSSLPSLHAWLVSRTLALRLVCVAGVFPCQLDRIRLFFFA